MAKLHVSLRLWNPRRPGGLSVALARLGILFTVLVGLSTLPLWGQGIRPDPMAQMGTILRGVVTEGDQPAVGATIELFGASTGGTMTAITLNDGSFEIHDLPPGHYMIITSSGTQQVTSDVDVTGIDQILHISLPATRADTSVPGGSNSVSVQQLKVPHKARSELADAQKDVQHGKIRHALSRIEKALTIWPSFAEALTLRAALELGTGDRRNALSDAQAATRSDPGYPSGYFVLAAGLNNSGRFADAERSANQGIRLDPRAWQGHFELGQALSGQARDLAALQEFNNAAQSAPQTFFAVYLCRAVTLARLRRYPEAQKDLQNVIDHDKQPAEVATAKQLLAQVQQVASKR